MKREGPIALLMISGVLYIVSVMLASPVMNRLRPLLTTGIKSWSDSSILVGIISLTQVNGRAVLRKSSGWFYNALLIVVLYGYIILGLVGGVGNVAFTRIYDNILTPILMTIFSTLTFWIGSAAYRAFRAKNLDAAILLVAGIVVMIGRVTLGSAISPAIPKAAEWILNFPTVAGMRAIEMGAAIGGIVLALRMITGLERSFMSND